MQPPPDELPASVLPAVNPPAGAAWYKPSDPLPSSASLLAAPYDCGVWKGKVRGGLACG